MPYHRPIPEAKQRGKASLGLQALVEAEKMIQIAILMPVTAILGWLIGAWLDTRLHQSWIGFAGILLGGIAGLIYVVRLALAAEKTAAQPAQGEQPKENGEQQGRRGKME